MNGKTRKIKPHLNYTGKINVENKATFSGWKQYISRCVMLKTSRSFYCTVYSALWLTFLKGFLVTFHSKINKIKLEKEKPDPPFLDCRLIHGLRKHNRQGLFF